MSNQHTPIYALIEVTIKDPPTFMRYVQGHMGSVAQYGGSFVAEYETLRPLDDLNVQRTTAWHLLVIQEWPSEEHFQRWWHSPEYAEWKALRPAAADVSLTFSRKLAHQAPA